MSVINVDRLAVQKKYNVRIPTLDILIIQSKQKTGQCRYTLVQSTKVLIYKLQYIVQMFIHVFMSKY